MTYFRDQKCKFTRPVITMGTFDGVHLGHQKLLNRLVERARETKGKAVVITYLHHPLETIHRKTFPYLLTEIKVKERLLRALGIDCILYLDFTSELADMEPDEFLQKIILDEINTAEIIAGYDTHFGKNRTGDHQFLQKKAEEFGYRFELVPPLKINNRIVSSSIIRDYIREGNMEETARLLGREYSISGVVQKGHKIGRGLGFPTINVKPDDKNKLIPAVGVYTCHVKVDQTDYYGLTNVGYSPTLKTTGILEVETHIINFQGDLYNKQVEIFFSGKLRDEKYFESKEKLIEAIKHDLVAAKEFFGLKE